jgi:hypothetical protein
MEQEAQSRTTGTPPLGWLHQRSLRKDFTSSTRKKDESPRNTRSGSMLSVDPTVAVDAINLVEGDRQEQYGSYDENLSRIAAMWSGYLGKEIDAMDVSLMMVLLKISRSKAGYARDNAVDGVAYFLMHDSLARYDGGK